MGEGSIETIKEHVLIGARSALDTIGDEELEDAEFNLCIAMIVMAMDYLKDKRKK